MAILVKPILTKATGSVILRDTGLDCPPHRMRCSSRKQEADLLTRKLYLKRQKLSMRSHVFYHFFCSLFWVWTFSLDFNLQLNLEMVFGCKGGCGIKQACLNELFWNKTIQWHVAFSVYCFLLLPLIAKHFKCTYQFELSLVYKEATMVTIWGVCKEFGPWCQVALPSRKIPLFYCCWCGRLWVRSQLSFLRIFYSCFLSKTYW